MEILFIFATIIVVLLLVIFGLFFYLECYEPNIIIVEDKPEFEPVIRSINKLNYEIPDKFYTKNKKITRYSSFLFGNDRKTKYAVYWENNTVWATIRLVLHEEIWQISDLKVHPDKRGQNIPYRMFCKLVFPACLDSYQGFAFVPFSKERNATAEKIGFEIADIYEIFIKKAKKIKKNPTLCNMRVEIDKSKKYYIDDTQTILYHESPTGDLIKNINDDDLIMYMVPSEKGSIALYQHNLPGVDWLSLRRLWQSGPSNTQFML
jgi:hypothetical protein